MTTNQMLLDQKAKLSKVANKLILINKEITKLYVDAALSFDDLAGLDSAQVQTFLSMHANMSLREIEQLQKTAAILSPKSSPFSIHRELLIGSGISIAAINEFAEATEVAQRETIRLLNKSKVLRADEIKNVRDADTECARSESGRKAVLSAYSTNVTERKIERLERQSESIALDLQTFQDSWDHGEFDEDEELHAFCHKKLATAAAEAIALYIDVFGDAHTLLDSSDGDARQLAAPYFALRQLADGKFGMRGGLDLLRDIGEGRIGMEVMVAFVDGDPDRPLVTGVVPNPANGVPYDLPGNKTRMVLRSNTHKGQGYNELSFEDEAGQENMFLHAQKDQTLKVLNNRVKRVEAHQVESVGQNKSIDVGQNHQEKIGGSMNLTVGGGASGVPLLGILSGIAAAGGLDSKNGAAAIDNPLLQQFAGAIASSGVATEASSLMANADVTNAGNFAKGAGSEQTSTGSALGGLLSKLFPLSGIVTTVIEKFRTDTIGIARTEQIGVYKNTTVGHTMTINAGEEFIIKCGQSKLMMDKDGNVTITGTKFNFAASGHVQINGDVIDLN